MDIADIIEESYELAGWEARSAQDAITARRSLNLIFADWTNWGVNLWTLEEITTDLVAGTASYSLTSRTIDVLEAVINEATNDTDRPIQRISIEEYHHLPDKTARGQPSLYAITRGQDVPTLYLYPTPDDSTDDFKAWQIRYMQDVDNMVDNADVPRRFLPALVYRLAYEVSFKKKVNSTEPEALKEDRARRKELLEWAGILFERAREGDSEAADMLIRPAGR
jgi:hypothetical protein